MLLAGKEGGSLCCWSLNLEELLPPFLRDPQSRRKMNKKLWRRNRMRTEKWKAEFKIKEPSVQKCAEKTNQKQKKRHKAAALETTRPLPRPPPLNNWSLPHEVTWPVLQGGRFMAGYQKARLHPFVEQQNRCFCPLGNFVPYQSALRG